MVNACMQIVSKYCLINVDSLPCETLQKKDEKGRKERVNE